MLTRIALVVIVAMTTLGLGPAASAGGTGAEGHLVWTKRSASGSEHLMIARADGSRPRTLTTPRPDTVDLDPTISPDGRWVLYGRETPTGLTTRIVRVDGRHDRAVDLPCADPCIGTAAATWLSSKRIAYTKVVGPFEGPNESAASAVLWSARPNGTDVRRLSAGGIDGAYEDDFARVSPGGDYLTFKRIRNADLRSALFRMDRHGVRQLTPWELRADHYDLSPARFGPTKDLIVFQTFGKGDPDGTSLDLATVPTTCRTLAACAAKIRYLTENGASGRRNANPSWSLSGRRLVFTDRVSEAAENADLWTMRYDGRHWRQVTRSPEFEYRPDWGR